MTFYRKIYRLDISLCSPLSIGSGTSESTDKDVIVDRSGVPFIPATSIAGVLRGWIERKNEKAVVDAIFGNIENEGENSLVRVYDGLCVNHSKKAYFITVRDMVALKDKVNIKGAKFDMEAVETGTRFTAYLELLSDVASNAKTEAQIDISAQLESALAALNAGELRLGTKTSRGYGEVSVMCKKKEFCEPLAWIDFDMTNDDAWSDADAVELKYAVCSKITLGLRLKGGLSIREYTTEPGTPDMPMPDYRQLALHTEQEKEKTVPVIPGTSWAGAIRERYAQFDSATVETMFGYVLQKPEDGKVSAQKSVIQFGESRITGGTWKTVTLNAIDRFSGGTKSGALYTEETYYGGETALTVFFAQPPERKQLQILCACFADLHNGYLSVGGLTAVGRGLFEIVSINNGPPLSEEQKKPDHIFEVLRNEVIADE